MKVMKEAAQMGLGGTQKKIDEIQKTDLDFKEKELTLLGKFEDKIDEVIASQKIILNKLNEIQQEMK